MATRSSPAHLSTDDSLPQARLAADDSHSAGGKAAPVAGYLQGARSASAYADTTNAPADQHAPRKFQRAPSENDNPLQDMSTAKASADPKPSFAGRRRSTVREHKAPLGPRAMDTGRRIVSGSTSTNNASRLPTSTSEPFIAPATTGSNPRFSFGKLPSRVADSSYDFLPSVNFDDFHESLSGPELSDFPVPGGGRGMFSHEESDNDTMNSVATAPPERKPASRAPSTASFSRRPSLSQHRQPSHSDLKDASAGQSTAPLPVRTRRQSQFSGPAPVSDNSTFSSASTTVRGPRKSVGPGLLSAAGMENQHQFTQRREVSQGNLGHSRSISKNNRMVPSYNSDVPRLSTATRSSKTKSLLQPSSQSYASLSPDLGRAHGNARSPTKGTPQKNAAPSTANKRQSLHHAGGLGARTISPTDARRLKRMSMGPNVSASPRNPPTPQPDTQQEPLPASYSPALAFRKSITPSSARATPDNNSGKSIPAPPLSNSSSFSSLRGASQIPTRSSQILSTSRLPTPKPRNVHSSAGPENTEEVPPVPAIPKAFESPRTEIDQPLYPTRQTPATPATPATEEPNWSTCLAETTDSDNNNKKKMAAEAKTAAKAATETANNDNKKAKSTTGRHRRGLTVGADSETDKGAHQAGNSRGNKGLAPLRLPPLNLLPLSTPTAAKIASYPQPSAEVDDRGPTTPPPKRNYTKTPSTPLTASKATFGFHDEEMPEIRSNTSHYHLRSTLETPSFPPLPAEPIPIPETSNEKRNSNTTPFSSNSLPKTEGDFGALSSKVKDEYEFGSIETEPQSSRLNGPRAQTTQTTQATQATHTTQKNDASSVTSTEPETPSSGSSIRRKLSLSWKRSSSKGQHRSQASQGNIAYQSGTNDQPPQPPKHNDMPPPKLPASAAWNAPANQSTPSPSSKTQPTPRTARRKPSGSLFASDSETQHSTNGERKVSLSNKGGQPPPYTGPTTRSASSSMMHKMLGTKSSINALKARALDTNLDKEDLAADEEMRRLNARRKDFDQAAKDVDELRKRAKPQERVSPAHALQMVPLNIFERGEIIDYKEVYFCGTKSAKKRVGDLHASTANFGYDDDRGDYQIVLGDHLAYRYEVVDVLGKGSFGQVVRCVDHKTGKLVAIKIIRNKKRFHQQALVEVNILQKLREWDPDNKHSMINFTQHFYFRGHLCISTELLGMNLYEFIKAHEFKGFTLRLIRRFARQILSSLVLLKGKRVIHCDLKPENILLAHPLHSEIKVIDFGSSCFEHEKVYTYIQSRFYRSPEVILGMNYGLPIDMWSFGCILAELLTGSPIFPGENEQEQLACIMEIFGPPEKHLIEKSSRKKLFFDSLGKPRVTVSSKGRRRRPSSKTLEQALKCNDDAFLDFIARCLRWDPDRRMKPEEAMQHEFITGIKRPRGGPRHANATQATSSPIKRYNTVAHQTPQRTRPLPEPPATSFKNGNAQSSTGPGRAPGNNSPAKTGPPRRHSTVNGMASNLGMKRGSNGQNSTGAGNNNNASATQGQNSALPRVAQRSVSGKPDLASAAAVASLRSR